jgi:hypothetical protein
MVSPLRGAIRRMFPDQSLQSGTRIVTARLTALRNVGTRRTTRRHADSLRSTFYNAFREQWPLRFLCLFPHPSAANLPRDFNLSVSAFFFLTSTNSSEHLQAL